MTRTARALGVLLLLAGLAAFLELASWVAWRVTEGSFFTWGRAFALRAEAAASAPVEPDPEAGEEFLRHFYRDWTGDTTAAAALCKTRARLRASERWAAPRYWAGWQLWMDAYHGSGSD